MSNLEYRLSLSSKIVWFNVLNALDKSKYMVIGILPFSILLVIVSMMSRAAKSVECLLQKPYCPS